MISFNMKVSIFLLFTILTVLQARSQKKYKIYNNGQLNEHKHKTQLSSNINYLEPAYNDDHEGTHFHAKVKVVCCGQATCQKKLKNSIDYSDRQDVIRRKKTSGSSKTTSRGSKSNTWKNNKNKKYFEGEYRFLTRKGDEFKSDMNNARFAKGRNRGYQSTAYFNDGKNEEYFDNGSGKFDGAFVNQEGEREIYSKKGLGISHQKVLSGDFDDKTSGATIGTEHASRSLYGEDDDGINGGDREDGSDKKVLDFDDEELGTIIGTDHASRSLNGEDDDGINGGDRKDGSDKKALSGDFDDETSGATIGVERASRSLNGEDNDGIHGGDRKDGSDKKALSGDFDDETSGATIGVERASRSLNGEDDDGIHGGDREDGSDKKVLDFDDEELGTIIGTEHTSRSLNGEDDDGINGGDRKDGSDKKVLSGDFDDETSRATIGTERASRSLNGEDDDGIHGGDREDGSDKKVLDFDDEELGTIIGTEHASRSLNGEGDDGINGGDREDGSDKKVLSGDFDDKTSGATIGTENASHSLNGESDVGINGGDREDESDKKVLDFDDEELGTIIGPKSTSTSLYGEGDDGFKGGDKVDGSNKKVFNENFDHKMLGTSIESESASTSLYDEGDKGSTSGCIYESCPCGGCKECGGCTILGCDCVKQKGNGFGGMDRNSSNINRKKFGNKTLGTSIQQRKPSSPYGKSDKKSTSGCIYESCPCGGCKVCGGCTILGCDCVKQKGNGFDGMNRNSSKINRKKFGNKTLGTSIQQRSKPSSPYGKSDKKSTSGCIHESCPCGGCKVCGGCTILGCDCVKQKGNGFGGMDRNSSNIIRKKFGNKTLGTSIQQRSKPSSPYVKSDKKSTSGCIYERCPCGGCKVCGGCTILGCDCEKQKGFGGMDRNSSNIIRKKFGNKTLGTSIQQRSKPSSPYGKSDKKSTSGCIYERCPCGGCKVCGGCTILGCDCEKQRSNGFGKVKSNPKSFRRNLSNSKIVPINRQVIEGPWGYFYR